MPSQTTLGETLRTPLDGTEQIRLATAGANWRAPLSQNPWVFGGIVLGGTGSQFNYKSEINDASGTVANSTFAITQWASNNARIILSRSAGGAIGTHGLIASGASVGVINWSGDDGSAFTVGAQITVTTEGTPAAGQMPSRMSLITANQSGTLVEGIRLDSNQVITTGFTAQTFSNQVATLQIAGNTAGDSQAAIMRFTADNLGAVFLLGKSRNTTVGSHTIVTTGDFIGAINFLCDNGTNYNNSCAAIQAIVEGTVSATAVPGRIALYTTPAGQLVPVEALRVDSTQAVIALAGAFRNNQTAGSAVSTLDVSGQAGTSIATGSNALIINANALLVVINASSGNSAVYMVTAALVTLVTSPTAEWVAPTTTPAAGKSSVQWNGSNGYNIYNAVGSTQSYRVLSLKVA